TVADPAVELTPTPKPTHLTVRLRTREPEPREVTRELTVRLRPAAPKLVPDRAADQEVRKETYPFEARVVPAAEGQKVDVTLLVNDRKVDVEPRADGKELLVKQDLKLVPGVNRIVLLAANEGDETEEPARAGRVVKYAPEVETVLPPVVTLEK